MWLPGTQASFAVSPDPGAADVMGSGTLCKLLQKSQKFQSRSSPPFHPGGRGAKQLSKALELVTDAEERELAESFAGSGGDYSCLRGVHTSTCFVMCYGKEQPCYAKVVRYPDETHTLITPMKCSPLDAVLLVPITGRLWLADNADLVPVEVSE